MYGHGGNLGHATQTIFPSHSSFIWNLILISKEVPKKKKKKKK